MHELHDKVRVIHGCDEEAREFVGQEGVILEVDNKTPYKYHVLFFDDDYRYKDIKTGGVLWREADLEGI